MPVLGDRLDLHRGEQRPGVDLDLGTGTEHLAIAGDEHVRRLLEGELPWHESADLGVLDDDLVGAHRVLVSVGDRWQRVVGSRSVGVASARSHSERCDEQDRNDALLHARSTLPTPPSVPHHVARRAWHIVDVREPLRSQA